MEARDGSGSAPHVAALAAALQALVGSSGEIEDAVKRHDREALESANERADAAVARVSALSDMVSPADRDAVAAIGIPELCELLASGARRNAHLIERAWATDAGLIRLLAGLGRAASDRGAGGYAAEYAVPAGPAILDRDA